MECSQSGTSFCRISVVGGKGCSSSGQPSSSVRIKILAMTEAEIWLLYQISAILMECKSAMSSVATFVPITDGQSACGVAFVAVER